MTTSAPTSIGGWGSGGWGASPWGGSASESLSLVSAVAVRENVIRLTFNQAPFFDGLLSPNDASNASRYAVVAVAGTVGMDGFATRTVAPLRADVAIVELSFGSVLDVSLDRPMSPYPSQYRISVNNLIALASGIGLDSDATSAVIYGVRALITPNLTSLVAPLRDVANPQTAQGVLEASGNPNAVTLGGFAYDDTGDYATDDGTTNLKKRVLRRLITAFGGFAYMSDYGVGMLASVKKLGTAGVRNALARNAEFQIAQEPDVRAVSVTSTQRAPGLVVFRINIQTRTGTSVVFQAPIQF